MLPIEYIIATSQHVRNPMRSGFLASRETSGVFSGLFMKKAEYRSVPKTPSWLVAAQSKISVPPQFRVCELDFGRPENCHAFRM
jgi:hypothetical protein